MLQMPRAEHVRCCLLGVCLKPQIGDGLLFIRAPLFEVCVCVCVGLLRNCKQWPNKGLPAAQFFGTPPRKRNGSA